MTPVAELVRSTAHDLTPSPLQLPPFVWSVFTAVNQVHGLWRWYRRAQLYTNPNNFAQLLAGHAVNLIFGDSLLLKIAAQSLLIATRMLECSQQQASLCREGKRLLEAMKGHYPKPVEMSWIDRQPNSWVSPSSAFGWKVTYLNIRNRITRVALIALNLCKKAFTFSMSLMDAIDAFYLSPATSNEGINESFVNIIKWLDTIVENKESLLQGLKDNKSIIEKILKGSPFQYDQLENAVAKTLEKTEAIHHHAKKIQSFGNGIIIDFGKRALNGGMVVAGLADYRPAVLAQKE